MRKTFVINTLAQIKALGSPVRMTLVDRVVELGPVSARELAAEVGLRRTAVYHHLNILVEHGLIVALETENGRDLYQAVAIDYRIDRTTRSPEWDRALGDMAGQFCSMLARRFKAAYQDSTAVRSADWLLNEVHYDCGELRLAPEDLAELNREMRALLRKVRQLGAKNVGNRKAGKLFNFSVFLVPELECVEEP